MRAEKSLLRRSASRGSGGGGGGGGGGTPPVVPGQPTGLVINSVTANSAALSWTASSTGTAPITYQIEYKPAFSSTWTVSTSGVLATSSTVTGLTASTAYDFRVLASNAAGSSSYSSPASATTSGVVAPPSGRVAQITTRSGGRPAIAPPQTFWDLQTTEQNDANTHPDVGPFTVNAVGSGNWSNPGIWDAGVPGPGARVNTGNFTVTYDVEMPNENSAINSIHVGGSGKLQWDTSKDTRLYVDTIISHGRLAIGESGNPVPESTTLGKPRAHIVFKRSQAPGITVRLGLVTMGPTRMLGAVKAHRLFAPSTLNAGAGAIGLNGLSSAGWRVGDKVLIVGTSNAGTTGFDPLYTGPTSYWGILGDLTGVIGQIEGFHQSHDEVRTITGISGETLILDAGLSFTHALTTGTLASGQFISINPVVCNLSRSIRMESYRPAADSFNTHLRDLQNRAHSMFMHVDDIDVRWVEALNMARTDVDPTLVVPGGIADPDYPFNLNTHVYSADKTTILANPLNVRGRYAFHVHGTGPYVSRRMVVLEGVVARGQDGPALTAIPQPGWAITHHNSRCAFEKCISYNTRGAGIVSENGSEIGQWIDCVSAFNRGDGFTLHYFARAENQQNHNGHMGVAYENQARQILQQGNIAASSNFGWVYHQQLPNTYTRSGDQYSLRMIDPISMGMGFGLAYGTPAPDWDWQTQDLIPGMYGPEQPQIPDFADNTTFACTTGFWVGHRQSTDRSDSTPLIARRFHGVNTVNQVRILNYTWVYSFYDFLWQGTFGGSSGSKIGNVAFMFNFSNGIFRNQDVGYFNNGIGFNYQGHVLNCLFENVATPVHGSYVFPGLWDTGIFHATRPGAIFPNDMVHYNLMGQWVSDPALSEPNVPNQWVGDTRPPSTLLATTAQLPLPYPYSAIPGSEPNGVDPEPGAPKPRAYIGGPIPLFSVVGAPGILGTIVDRVGVRYWPAANKMTESLLPHSPLSAADRSFRRITGITPRSQVVRNGCFNVGGSWYIPWWFIDHDRLTGEYIIFRTDARLDIMEGITPQMLADNTVDPMATRPVLPLVPEAVPLSAAI